MKTFWRCAFIRAVRTICQSAIAIIGASTVLSEIDWKMMLSASALSGLLSILTSIATGLPEVEYEKEDEDIEIL